MGLERESCYGRSASADMKHTDVCAVGEALVVEAILSPASDKPKNSDYQPPPTFTLIDILEDLTRASVLEVVREKAMRSLNCDLDDLLHVSEGLGNVCDIGARSLGAPRRNLPHP